LVNIFVDSVIIVNLGSSKVMQLILTFHICNTHSLIWYRVFERENKNGGGGLDFKKV